MYKKEFILITTSNSAPSYFVRFGVIIFLIMFLISSTCGAGRDEAAQNGTADKSSDASNIQSSLLDSILAEGEIRIGTTGDFNPLSFKDPSTGDYVGHDIELVQQLGADIGVDVQFVATDWKNLVSGVAAGKYHITTQASYNMERAKTVAYSLPVQGVGTVPLTLRENIARFQDWQDINSADVKVAVTLGTVFDEQVRKLLPNADRVAVEAPARDFQELLARRADVSITSTIEAAKLLATYSELAIIPVDPKFSNVMGLLVPQSDIRLLNYINVWLRMKRASGYLDELKEKWKL